MENSIEINGKKPKLKMATIVAVCTELNCKSAVEIIELIQSCGKEVENADGQKSMIIADLITYSKIGESFLFHSMDGQCTRLEVENYIDNFKVLNKIVMWVTDCIVGIMNPIEAQDPN